MSETSTSTQLLLEYLQLPDHQQPRLERLLNERPLRWSELADLGHVCHLGRRLQHCWSDVRTPSGFLGVRQLVGGRLVLDAWASAAHLDDTSTLDVLLQRRPPIRHIRRHLAEQLIAAPEPVRPWPTLTGDLEQLVFLPADVLTLTAADGQPEAVAAMGVMVQTGEHGPALSWAAWGMQGGSWSDGWSSRPDHTSPCSRLAWAIVALQHQEPEERLAASAATGTIRSPRERPEPSWITPPRRYVSEADLPAANTGGHVRPHWRQAHAHRYWTGLGRAQLTTRWLPAIWVDGALQEEANP